jgi:hypothetical protein
MDFKYFIEELMAMLHLLLLQKVGIEKAEKESKLELLEIQKIFKLLTAAYLETKTAVLSQMPLEMVVIEWAGDDGNALRSSSDRDEFSNASAPAASTASGYVPQKRDLAKTSSQQTTPRADENNNGSISTPVVKNKALVELIDEVKKQNPLIAGLLRSCSADEVINGKLNIIASSKFHKEKLEDTKALKILSDSATKIFGKEIQAQVLMGGDK